MTPAQMIDRYIRLRDKTVEIKARHATELEPYSSIMRQLETELLKHLEETEASSLKCPEGTAYKQTATSVTVSDWPQALQFVREHELWDLLEARIAKTAALSVIEDTQKPIPGVKISQAIVLRVRAG